MSEGNTKMEQENTELKLTRRIKWRLPVVMAERGIHKRNKLQKMLKDIGIELSTVQVGRIFNEPPDSYKKNLLEGLMTVLNCELTDLMRVEHVGPDGQVVDPGNLSGLSAQAPVASNQAAPVTTQTASVPSQPLVSRGIVKPAKTKYSLADEEMPSIANKLPGYEPGKRIKLGALPQPAALENN